MRCLVTGATGFIGRRLAARLLAERSPDTIACLVKPPTKPMEATALESLRNTGVRIIEGDLVDPRVSRETPPQIDVVFHLAANIDTAASEEALRVNDAGIVHLLDWLGSVSRGARIVYSSSIAVQDRNGPALGPLREASPCTPRTAYGRTKLRGERLLQARAPADGYSYTVLRLATVYGPGGKPGGLFDLLFKLTAKERLLGRINWPGRTSIIHVDDVAAVMVGLALRPEAANEIYCVANAEAPTVGELAQHIGRVSGHPVRPVDLPARVWSLTRGLTWNALVRAVVPPSRRLALWRFSLIVDDGFWFDTSKLRSAWPEPFRRLEDGLAEMLVSPGQQVPYSLREPARRTPSG